MKSVLTINTINEYNSIAQQETLHPLVSVINFSALKRRKKRDKSNTAEALSFGFYLVFLKEDSRHCEIRYGRNTYDYQEATLVFIAPGQVISIKEDGDDYKPSGYALLFHPDLIHGTSLGKHIQDYSFFSYDVHEALHVSEQERRIVLECFQKIGYELKHAIDKHSKKLIVSNIELFLDYCIRFYDRQFITREHAGNTVLERFEQLIHEYLHSDKPQEEGVPSVAFFAKQLHLSSNYFGNLVKKQTGKSALELIQSKVVATVKEKIFAPGESISEVAYEPGVKYPQHFARCFKQQVGSTPDEYRGSLNKRFVLNYPAG